MKNSSTYLVPVEVAKKSLSELAKIDYYEYNIYTDKNELECTKLAFLDINGFIMGTHMPKKLLTIYDKAAEQLKSNTTKVVEEVKNITTDVSGLLNSAASEIKTDITGAISGVSGSATKLWRKLKEVRKSNETQDKL